VRVSEDRYAKDLRRLNLAQRLIQHEVRSQWIRAWTGFSDERVRRLFHAYRRTEGSVRRPRGPSPTRIASFLRSPGLHAEASAIGGLARALKVIPLPPGTGARLERIGVEGAERLCRLFEVYRQVAPHSRFSMDQLIRLVSALSESQEFEVGHCGNCHGALLLDRLGDARRVCPACRHDALNQGTELARPEADEEGDSRPGLQPEPGGNPQQSLF
jgi:hypothetical protein